jgi:hypothetical protein
VEAEGDVHIPDLTGSSSYQDIAAEEEQQEFYTDWAQLLQSKVGIGSYQCSRGGPARVLHRLGSAALVIGRQ